MAAKATASITISRIIDIASVTRYYLLQSSTSAAPAKPTTNPPSSSWTTTEPSYTSGSTNTLYFVDCTVFTNDAFSYSEVSKSSSYEAAKEAYNKADEAQTRITNAETKIEQNSNNITLRATADEVAKVSEDTETQINELQSQLSIQADSIASLIRNGEAGSLIKQDANGLYFFDISGLETSVSDSADKISDIEKDKEKIETDISDLAAKTEYIAVGTDENDKPYIELGEGDSDFKVKITNEQIQFKDGQSIPAYISNQKLMIEKAEVHNELRFGNFVWRTRANGNMGLTWEEVSS
jgi:hypothetical protein|nr:MAG TPA: hypothetical protein [Caudoviricetes sp.]